jgi:hypothetical protein
MRLLPKLSPLKTDQGFDIGWHQGWHQVQTVPKRGTLAGQSQFHRRKVGWSPRPATADRNCFLSRVFAPAPGSAPIVRFECETGPDPVFSLG